MSRYPDTPRPISPHAFRNHRPTVTGGPEWAPQTRGLTRFGLAEVDLAYRGKSSAEIMVLYNFFESVGGPAGRFTYVDFNGCGAPGGSDPGFRWSNLFVLKGTGSGTGPWDLPTFGLKQDRTTVAASIAAGTRTVTPASMDGIIVNANLTVSDSDGSAGEVVTVTAKTATTFTAVFANAHGSNWLVDPPLVFENGVAKVTEWNTTSPASGHYGVKPATGTDGVDSLYAGTSPGSGVIVTVSGVCRRAFRRAKFLNDRNPFQLNVPENYYQDTVTVVEVRT